MHVYLFETSRMALSMRNNKELCVHLDPYFETKRFRIGIMNPRRDRQLH